MTDDIGEIVQRRRTMVIYKSPTYRDLLGCGWRLVAIHGNYAELELVPR